MAKKLKELGIRISRRVPGPNLENTSYHVFLLESCKQIQSTETLPVKKHYISFMQLIHLPWNSPQNQPSTGPKWEMLKG